MSAGPWSGSLEDFAPSSSAKVRTSRCAFLGPSTMCRSVAGSNMGEIVRDLLIWVGSQRVSVLRVVSTQVVIRDSSPWILVRYASAVLQAFCRF